MANKVNNIVDSYNALSHGRTLNVNSGYTPNRGRRTQPETLPNVTVVGNRGRITPPYTTNKVVADNYNIQIDRLNKLTPQQQKRVRGLIAGYDRSNPNSRESIQRVNYIRNAINQVSQGGSYKGTDFSRSAGNNIAQILTRNNSKQNTSVRTTTPSTQRYEQQNRKSSMANANNTRTQNLSTTDNTGRKVQQKVAKQKEKSSVGTTQTVVTSAGAPVSSKSPRNNNKRTTGRRTMPRNRRYLDSTPANSSTYTIRRGDTLSDIARRNGTTVAQLARDNGISDVNRIIAGQTLNLGRRGAGAVQPINRRPTINRTDVIANTYNDVVPSIAPAVASVNVPYSPEDELLRLRGQYRRGGRVR